MSALYDELLAYNSKENYAFHMPGHKRNKIFEFVNPFDIDITEIDNFDDLHHAEGILKECMDYASSCYGSDRTFFLVNGSSCGILSAISAACEYGDCIAIARNCHKSAYNAVELRGLRPLYLYPEYISEYGISGGINPLEVEELLKKNNSVKAVLIVSPTYDGVCSEVEKIAEIVHRHNCVLIVDEAHGAHFKYNDYFPKSAVDCGADIVIQSLHKTLPSFTQTAILHVKSEVVDIDKVQKYLAIYQSSSPSYVFMAGIDKCIRWLHDEGKKVMEAYCDNLKTAREKIASMKNLSMVSEQIVNKYSVKDYDCGKIIISVKKFNYGKPLYDILRLKYNIQPEMCTDRCVTLITSVGDSREALEHLVKALVEIDNFITENKFYDMLLDVGYTDWQVSGLKQVKTCEVLDLKEENILTCNEQVYIPSKASVMSREYEDIDLCLGRISANYVYIYPPGIPVLVPGERINAEVLSIINRYIEAGLNVHGVSDGKLSVLV